MELRLVAGVAIPFSSMLSKNTLPRVSVLSELVEGASDTQAVARANIASIKEDFVVTNLQETDAQLGGVPRKKNRSPLSQAGLPPAPCNSPDCRKGNLTLSMALADSPDHPEPYPRRSFAEENG